MAITLTSFIHRSGFRHVQHVQQVVLLNYR